MGGHLGGGGRLSGAAVLAELLRSWQLSRKKRERGGFTSLAHNSCQSTLHRSQWKFIFPIGHISFRIRLDSMLKLIRNYINPNGFAVLTSFLAESIFSPSYYLAPPPPPPPCPVSMLSLFLRGEGGARSYDGEKAWSSINHSILSLSMPLAIPSVKKYSFFDRLLVECDVFSFAS
jgi:hypothetical protein